METAHPLHRAIKVLQTQSNVARVVGVTPQAVSDTVRKGRKVPAEWCIPLERATAEKGEMIPRGWLRPDLYPEREPTTQ